MKKVLLAFAVFLVLISGAQADLLEIPTADGNIVVDSVYPGYGKDRATHSPGDDYHDGSWHLSGENANDAYVIVDLNEEFLIEHVTFPFMYYYNFFTDVNVAYWDGDSADWVEIWSDSTFSIAECDWNGLGTTGHPYCDLNISFNLFTQKVRFMVDHSSKTAGYGDNKNSVLGMNNVVIYWDANSIQADYDYSPASPCVAPGHGINSVDVDLNDTSTAINLTLDEWLWDQNGTSFSSDQNTTQNYTAVGDYNVCLTAFADTNNYQDQVCQTISVSECSAGNLAMNFFDENTHAPVTPTTLTIDGNSWLPHLSGNSLDIDLNGFSPGTYTIVASDANRSARTWEYVLDWNSNVDINAMLIQDIYASSVDFNFTTPAGAILDNAYVTLLIQDTNTASRDQTDASGALTLYLNPNDANYTFYIEDDDGNTYTYYTTPVTVNIPKDETATGNPNITPFDIEVGGLGAQDYNGLTANQTFPILSGTTEYYSVEISASGYLARKYFIRVPAGTSSYTLQPWLLNDSNSISVWLYTKDKTTTTSIPYVTIVAKKQITGYGLVEVESRVSDISGSALFSFYPNHEYYIDVYIGDTMYIQNGYLVPTNTSYNIWLPLSSTTWEVLDGQRLISVQFFPAGGVAFHSSPFDVNQVISAPNGGISVINVLVTSGSTTLSDTNYTGDTGTTATYSVDPATMPAGQPLAVAVTIYWSDGNVSTFNKLYSDVDNSDPNIINLLQDGAKNEWCGGADPCLFTILIALLISGAVVGLASTRITQDLNALSMILLIMFGIFTYLTWLPWPVFVLSAVGSGLMFFLRQRTEDV